MIIQNKVKDSSTYLGWITGYKIEQKGGMEEGNFRKKSLKQLKWVLPICFFQSLTEKANKNMLNFIAINKISLLAALNTILTICFSKK